MTQLVLDLRDNGGGSVDEAARVAGAFLPQGTLVYTATGRKPEVGATVRVKRSFWKQSRSYPIIVLVNEGTASASELVAGALQDHDRALIVGQPSFGKALLMYGLPLSDGSRIMLVVGHVRTPCGRVVQRQYRGVAPREYYRLAGADRDTAGRPSCKSASGRTLYGGGGIYPDELLKRAAESPLWLRRALEAGVIVEWLGGHLQSSQVPENVEVFTQRLAVSAPEVERFISMAATHGIVVPSDSAAMALLQRQLLSAVAYAKWGDAGAARVDAALDPDLTAAISLFERAASLVKKP
jgi:carboxyl-terminal processing protease